MAYIVAIYNISAFLEGGPAKPEKANILLYSTKEKAIQEILRQIAETIGEDEDIDGDVILDEKLVKKVRQGCDNNMYIWKKRYMFTVKYCDIN